MSISDKDNALSKEDICKFVSLDTSLPIDVCTIVIESFLSTVKKGIKSGKRIKLREFGSFINKVKYRKSVKIDTVHFISSCILKKG